MRPQSLRRILSLVLPLCCCAIAGHTAENAAPQKHFFWKVTSGRGVVFLLGTIHVGTADLYPLPPVIESSFNKSSTLVEEINITDVDDTKNSKNFVAQNGAFVVGDFISNHLREETRNQLARFVTANGLNVQVILHIRPWALSMIVGNIEAKTAGLDGTKGLDKHFADEALKMHKPIVGLETNEGHLRLIASFSDVLQDQLLMIALRDANKATQQLHEILNAWKTGNSDALEAIITQPVHEYPWLKPVETKIIDERNDTMTQKIEEFLKTPKTYFVAVGAGHMVGERGIVSQLRAKNYKVEQM
ncbi:MAG TPA: TraB/GumN family protein [Stellaceae bacterium]|nr:TraB/GumN family protein [Stellaceae bacterium]